MGKFVLLDARIFAGATDLTSNSNTVELSCEMEEKDTTPFGNGGWMESLGGLASTEINGGGQWEAGVAASALDPATWDDLNNRRHIPWSVCPTSADVGSLAWFTEALRTSYTQGDEVGEVAPWEAEAVGRTPLVRGTVVHGPGTARTTSSAGSGVELGAVAEGQRLFASLHVVSLAGTSPSIDVTVESDVDNTFASPTTVITFNTSTGFALPDRGQFASAVGPITDTWFRLTWTLGGTSPSYLFLAALGIA